MLYLWLFAIFLTMSGSWFLEIYDYNCYKNYDNYNERFSQKNIPIFVELRKKQSLFKARINLFAILLILALGLARYYFPQWNW